MLVGYGEGNPAKAIAYVAGSAKDRAGQGFTEQYLVKPSEQYLTAIDGCLREHWGSKPMRLCAFDSDSPNRPRALGEWVHPGPRNLTLPAFCVEVSLGKQVPWKMPQTIKEVVGKLADVGVADTCGLAVALADAEALNARLVSKGHHAFSNCTIAVMKRLLSL